MNENRRQRVGLVKTDNSGPFSFEDTNSHATGVTQDSYLNLLANEVLPCPRKVVVYGRGRQLTLH